MPQAPVHGLIVASGVSSRLSGATRCSERGGPTVVVRCPTCQTAYRLDIARVPQAGVRVRCPRCASVFVLRASAASSPAPAPSGSPAHPAPRTAAAPAPALRSATQRPATSAPRPSAPLPQVAPAAPRAAAPPADTPGSTAPQDGLPGFEVDQRQPPRLRTSSSSLPGFKEQDAPAALPRRTLSAEHERTLELGASPAKPAPRLETPPFRPSSGPAPARRPATPAPAERRTPQAGPPPAASQPISQPRPVPPPPPLATAPGPAVRPRYSEAAPRPAAPQPTPAPPARSPHAPVSRPVVPASAGPAVTATAPASPPSPVAGPAHERAQRLARVLVSDILVYNQAVRDRARAEGNLPNALGPEISKAWELYKSKVSPEVAASTTYFKDALNAILAGGEEVF
jgi:predicted Zn finger-like uncharacterized protein